MFTRLRYVLIGSLGLVGMIGLAILFTQIAQNLRTKSFVQPMAPQQIAARVNAPTVETLATLIDSPLPTPTATLEPMPTNVPTPNPYPPIAWDPLPPCKNEPWDATQWLQYLTENSTEPAAKQALATLFLRQIHPMSAALQATDMDGLLDLLATKDDDSDKVKVLRRDVASVWLNVIGGHLHRVTELALADVPEAKTVNSLLTSGEAEIAKNSAAKITLAAFSQLLAGQGISKAICAQMLHMRLGNQFEQTTWAGDKIQLTRLPGEKFGWMMERLVPAPNYRKIAIQSFSYENGGPIFLFDPETGKLQNLIAELGQSLKPETAEDNLNFDQRSPWQVIGWHPDSQHLLLGVEGSAGAFWIDFQHSQFRIIKLDNALDINSSRTFLDLTPDGSGFVYINRNATKYKTNVGEEIDFFDLQTHQTTMLFKMATPQQDLRYPRMSPSGDSLLYLVDENDPKTGFTYEMRLFNLKTQEHTTLLKGDLGWTEPVWSPDGQSFAFACKDSTFTPNQLSHPLDEAWRGNLCVVSLKTGERKQVTSIQGAARNPVWSLDGQSLTFFTHDGQIGLVTIEQLDVIRQLVGPGLRPLFGFTLPLP